MDGSLNPGRQKLLSGRKHPQGVSGEKRHRHLALAASGTILLGSALLAGGYWLQLTRQSVPVAAMAPGSAAGPRLARGERWVVVQPGDTLWSLAVKHGPAGADPRRYVDAILRENPGADAARLRPGQALYLPHP
ncbi:MAG: LysM domain-containing protein [Bacillota bacterium]